MRLGAYPAMLTAGQPGRRRCYGTEVVSERHRHRYEVNSRYRSPGSRRPGWSARATRPTAGWSSSSSCPATRSGSGTQAHPEFKSRPERPHPLFRGARRRGAGAGRGPRAAPDRARPALSAAAMASPEDGTRSSRSDTEIVWHGRARRRSSGRRFRGPDGEEFEREYTRHPGAVGVIAVDDDERVDPRAPVPRPDGPDRPRDARRHVRRRRREARGDGPPGAGRGGRPRRRHTGRSWPRCRSPRASPTR